MNWVKQTIQPHGRIAIRNQVKALLRAAVNIPADKWFCSRPTTLFLPELPCGLIYFTEEVATDNNTAPRMYTRALSLSTDVLLYQDTIRENGMDDWLDSRAYEIEAAMTSDRQLGLKDLVQDCILVSTQPLDTPDPQGDKLLCAIRLLWKIEYVMQDYGTISLDEFLRFEHKIESSAPDGADINAITQIRSA